MTWFGDNVWPGPAVMAIRYDITRLAQQQHKILEELKAMAAREEAAYVKLSADIATVKEGWAALVASNAAKDTRIAELEAALAAADPTAAVAAALELDSDADAAKVEAADATLAALVAPPAAPEPPVA